MLSVVSNRARLMEICLGGCGGGGGGGPFALSSSLSSFKTSSWKISLIFSTAFWLAAGGE